LPKLVCLFLAKLFEVALVTISPFTLAAISPRS